MNEVTQQKRGSDDYTRVKKVLFHEEKQGVHELKKAVFYEVYLEGGILFIAREENFFER